MSTNLKDKFMENFTSGSLRGNLTVLSLQLASQLKMVNGYLGLGYLIRQVTIVRRFQRKEV